MGIGAVLLAAAAAANPFTLGVAAGEVRPTSVQLWAHATPGVAQLEVARNRTFRGVIVRETTGAMKSRNGTIHATVRALRPATVYYYRFRRGRFTSATGRFATAPSATSNTAIRFAFSGDADAQPPRYNAFDVYARMAAESNAFNINLGDTIYSDSEHPGVPAALTRAAKWAKYRLNLSLPALQRLRAGAGLYSHWDDHEFMNDFSRAEDGSAVYTAGARAFTDYAPVTYSSANGLYRTFRWGRNLELFFLDERSFRSAKASEGGTCNTSGGTADLAPTAPSAVRAAFAQLIPPLGQPPPAGCIARIDDPSRTMLGSAQYERFTAAIARSTATFNVVVNEVPIQQFYALPYDRWEGYAAERQRLLHFLQENVKNVVFLTTDTHADFINDVRFQTLEPGGPVSSGMTEVVTGPVATRTFAQEIDNTLGTTGAGILISGLFFKPAPPRGVGMRRVSPDVYSYAEVAVTRATLTVTPKDATGRIVNDITGLPCTPVVIQAR
jgi:alkaline phosphatase D